MGRQSTYTYNICTLCMLHSYTPGTQMIRTKWAPDKQSLEKPMPWDLSQDLSIYFPMAGTVTESCFHRVHETVEFGDPVALKEVVILWLQNIAKSPRFSALKMEVYKWKCMRACYCWMFLGRYIHHSIYQPVFDGYLGNAVELSPILMFVWRSLEAKPYILGGISSGGGGCHP